MHFQDPESSYLNPKKLFAIVDLDIQNSNLSKYKYHFENTELIHKYLYEGIEIQIDKVELSKHRIFLTGLIHKEAYFFLLDLDGVFRNFKCRLNYKNEDLNKIYLELAEELSSEKDLRKYFQVVKDYTAFHEKFKELNSIEELKETWLQLYDKTSSEEKRVLLHIFLMIKRVKSIWDKIDSKEWTGNKENLRVMLEVTDFLSKMKDDNSFHLSQIFYSLRKVS